MDKPLDLAVDQCPIYRDPRGFVHMTCHPTLSPGACPQNVILGLCLLFWYMGATPWGCDMTKMLWGIESTNQYLKTLYVSLGEILRLK